MLVHSEDNPGLTAILRTLSWENKIRVVHYCIKNVETDYQLAQCCVSLIREWLDSPGNRITIEHNLRKIIDGINGPSGQLISFTDIRSPFYYAARALVVFNDDYDISRAIYYGLVKKDTYVVDVLKYAAIASSFRSRTTLTKPLFMIKALDKKDPNTVLALFDELQENDEDIIQSNGKLRLNLPKFYDVEGGNHLQLAENVIKDELAFDWLKIIYRGRHESNR